MGEKRLQVRPHGEHRRRGGRRRLRRRAHGLRSLPEREDRRAVLARHGIGGHRGSPYFVDGVVLLGTEEGALFALKHDPNPVTIDHIGVGADTWRELRQLQRCPRGKSRRSTSWRRSNSPRRFTPHPPPSTGAVRRHRQHALRDRRSKDVVCCPSWHADCDLIHRFRPERRKRNSLRPQVALRDIQGCMSTNSGFATALNCEPLEARDNPAGNVSVAVSGGIIFVQGDAAGQPRPHRTEFVRRHPDLRHQQYDSERAVCHLRRPRDAQRRSGSDGSRATTLSMWLGFATFGSLVIGMGQGGDRANVINVSASQSVEVYAGAKATTPVPVQRVRKLRCAGRRQRRRLAPLRHHCCP